MRRPMAIAIENLKHTEIDFESVNTWDALRPISDFTKHTSNRVILLSTLMLVGFIGYNLCARTKETPNKAIEAIGDPGSPQPHG